jgi:type IV pilus assembly protein PilC
MSIYSYTAKNNTTGEIVNNEIEAESENSAIKSIKASGYVVLDLEAKDKKGLSLFSSTSSNSIARVKAKDKVLFFRQLSTLMNAGLPLSQSLKNVGEQTTNKRLKTVIFGILTDIEGGGSFSSALAKYPKVFTPLMISLIAAGETSGTLDKSLDRIAIQTEKDADIVGKIRGAMIYPLIVLLVMIGVVTFMLVKVLPQVNVLYQAFPGQSLPIETKILLIISNFIIKYWWIVIIVIALMVYGWIKWLRTSGGRKIFDRFKLHTPPFNKLFQKVYMSRFSRTASTLVGSGVPLLQTLQITADAVSNTLVKESILRASEKVKTGKSLGEALTGDPNFLPLVPSMLKIGEASGSIEQMMNKTADYYEKEVDNEIQNISSLIEPVMMVILGLVALMIVAAVLLPVYGLAASGAVSGGGV